MWARSDFLEHFRNQRNIFLVHPMLLGQGFPVTQGILRLIDNCCDALLIQFGVFTELTQLQDGGGFPFPQHQGALFPTRAC